MDFNTLLRELTIRALLWDAIAYLVGVITLYLVIRIAVRDAINDAQLLHRRRVADAPPPAAGTASRPDDLPDMRADR